MLLTIEEYQRITGNQQSIVELLAMPDATDIDFDPPRLDGPLYQAADLTFDVT